MTDREWRFAVEQQRLSIENLETVEGHQKKRLSDTRAELKGERKRLDRLLRGEDEDPSDPDEPGLFDGPGGAVAEPLVDLESVVAETPPKKRARKK